MVEDAILDAGARAGFDSFHRQLGHLPSFHNWENLSENRRNFWRKVAAAVTEAHMTELIALASGAGDAGADYAELRVSMKPENPVHVITHTPRGGGKSAEVEEFRRTYGPVYCAHANEMPNVCPCPPGCYCRKEGNCPNVTPMLQRNGPFEYGLPVMDTGVRYSPPSHGPCGMRNHAADCDCNGEGGDR